jgi:hypothetical protein
LSSSLDTYPVCVVLMACCVERSHHLRSSSLQDVEKSIAENKLIASVEASETGAGAAEFSLDGDKLLDALLTYLWQVHFVDYYGGLEARSGRGDRQHRSTPVSEGPATPEGTAWEQKVCVCCCKFQNRTPMVNGMFYDLVFTGGGRQHLGSDRRC